MADELTFESLAERVLLEEAAHALEDDDSWLADADFLGELLAEEDSDKVSCEGHGTSSKGDYGDLLDMVHQVFGGPTGLTYTPTYQGPTAEYTALEGSEPDSSAPSTLRGEARLQAPEQGKDSDNFEEYSKQQRRLARNREAAKLSRERRRKHVTKLEGEVAELRRSQSHLQYAASVYFYENLQLRAELQRLQAAAASPSSSGGTAAPTTATIGMARGGEPAPQQQQPELRADDDNHEAADEGAGAADGRPQPRADGIDIARTRNQTTQSNRPKSNGGTSTTEEQAPDQPAALMMNNQGTLPLVSPPAPLRAGGATSRSHRLYFLLFLLSHIASQRPVSSPCGSAVRIARRHHRDAASTKGRCYLSFRSLLRNGVRRLLAARTRGNVTREDITRASYHHALRAWKRRRRRRARTRCGWRDREL